MTPPTPPAALSNVCWCTASQCADCGMDKRARQTPARRATMPYQLSMRSDLCTECHAANYSVNVFTCWATHGLLCNRRIIAINFRRSLYFWTYPKLKKLHVRFSRFICKNVKKQGWRLWISKARRIKRLRSQNRTFALVLSLTADSVLSGGSYSWLPPKILGWNTVDSVESLLFDYLY